MSLSAADYLTADGLENGRKPSPTTIKALHGDGRAHGERLGDATYFIDVSEYVLGVCIDPELTAKNTPAISGLRSYSYKGDYVKDSKGVEGFAAYLYDTAQKVSYDDYDYYTPISVCGSYNMIKGMSGVKDKNAYVFNDIASADCEEYFFQCRPPRQRTDRRQRQEIRRFVEPNT